MTRRDMTDRRFRAALARHGLDATLRGIRDALEPERTSPYVIYPANRTGRVRALRIDRRRSLALALKTLRPDVDASVYELPARDGIHRDWRASR